MTVTRAQAHARRTTCGLPAQEEAVSGWGRNDPADVNEALRMLAVGTRRATPGGFLFLGHHMTIYLSLLVAIIGALELGRIAFGAGLLAFLLQFTPTVVGALR